MNMRPTRRRVDAGRVISMLKGLMDKSEALSLSVGSGGPSFVIGHVGGNRREMIYMHSGDREIVLNENWIDDVEEHPDKVIVRGSFNGGVMLFKPYYKHRTQGIIDAESAGGDAGWLIESIERLKTQCEENEMVWVTTEEWNGELRKLQWVEYDKPRDEVLLVVGRLDKLRRVRLKGETVGDAKCEDGGIDVQAQWGAMIEIFIDTKTADREAAAEAARNASGAVPVQGA